MCDAGISGWRGGGDGGERERYGVWGGGVGCGVGGCEARHVCGLMWCVVVWWRLEVGFEVGLGVAMWIVNCGF